MHLIFLASAMPTWHASSHWYSFPEWSPAHRFDFALRTHAVRSTSSVRSRRACPAATTAMSRLLRWGRTSNAALRPTFRYAYGWLFSQNIAFCGKMVMFQFLCNKTVFCFDVGVCFQRMYFPHAPGLGLGIICGYMDEEKKHVDIWMKKKQHMWIYGWRENNTQYPRYSLAIRGYLLR